MKRIHFPLFEVLLVAIVTLVILAAANLIRCGSVYPKPCPGCGKSMLQYASGGWACESRKERNCPTSRVKP